MKSPEDTSTIIDNSYSNDLLCKKVQEFVYTPRILNAKMRQVISTQDTTSFEMILSYCLRKGWIDAIARERFTQHSKIIANAPTIIASLRKGIVDLSESVCNFESWHNSLCMSSEYGMRYGVWQKFINMTLKYLYCFKDVPSIKGRIPWNDLHCPIDSVIAGQTFLIMQQLGIADADKIIESIAKNGLLGVSWNNINKDEYEHVQSTVSDLCMLQHIPSKLAFDFIYWSRN
jgi:hypothetical protein